MIFRARGARRRKALTGGGVARACGLQGMAGSRRCPLVPQRPCAGRSRSPRRGQLFGAPLGDHMRPEPDRHTPIQMLVHSHRAPASVCRQRLFSICNTRLSITTVLSRFTVRSCYSEKTQSKSLRWQRTKAAPRCSAGTANRRLNSAIYGSRKKTFGRWCGHDPAQP
jgi:hypothetical protein